MQSRGQTKRCVFSFITLRRRGLVVSRRERAVNAHVVKEKQTGRELVSKGDRRRKTRRETSACTQPRRWRCVKVEVLSSDLIIYAAGCRGLPLRFTALRKQEQIEWQWMVLANRREPLRRYIWNCFLHCYVIQVWNISEKRYKRPIVISWFSHQILITINLLYITLNKMNLKFISNYECNNIEY